MVRDPTRCDCLAVSVSAKIKATAKSLVGSSQADDPSLASKTVQKELFQQFLQLEASRIPLSGAECGVWPGEGIDNGPMGSDFQ